MLVTLLGMIMLVREVQPENAPYPILVTLEVAVKVTLVREVQPPNELAPILVTLLGMIMLVILVQFWNALV
jgi:hypothetical protein